jgi:hypothetical protein
MIPAIGEKNGQEQGHRTGISHQVRKVSMQQRTCKDSYQTNPDPWQDTQCIKPVPHTEIYDLHNEERPYPCKTHLYGPTKIRGLSIPTLFD